MKKSTLLMVLMALMGNPAIAASSSAPIGFFQVSFENTELPSGWSDIPSLTQVWRPAQGPSSEGEFSLKTATGYVEWRAEFSQGHLNFDLKTGNGTFWLKLDDQSTFKSAFHSDWQTVTLPITAGEHAIRLSYYGVSYGGDTNAYVDNIRFVPLNQDIDQDQMPDQWELNNGFDYTDATDATLDPDQDGLTNAQEYQLGTMPNNFDSDGDNVNDKLDSSPLDPKGN